MAVRQLLLGDVSIYATLAAQACHFVTQLEMNVRGRPSSTAACTWQVFSNIEQVTLAQWTELLSPGRWEEWEALPDRRRGREMMKLAKEGWERVLPNMGQWFELDALRLYPLFTRMCKSLADAAEYSRAVDRIRRVHGRVE